MRFNLDAVALFVGGAFSAVLDPVRLPQAIGSADIENSTSEELGDILDKRTPDGRVILCKGANYGPPCYSQGYLNTHCYGFDQSYEGIFGTVAPIGGGDDATCNVYRGQGCSGKNHAWIRWSDPPVSAGDGAWESIACANSAWNDCHVFGTCKRSIEKSKQAATELEKRIPSMAVDTNPSINGYMHFCSLPGFTGDCTTLQFVSNECHNVDASLQLVEFQSATSLGDTFNYCVLFREAGCNGDKSLPVGYPGIDNFETHGMYGVWGSWSCKKTLEITYAHERV